WPADRRWFRKDRNSSWLVQPAPVVHARAGRSPAGNPYPLGRRFATDLRGRQVVPRRFSKTAAWSILPSVWGFAGPSARHQRNSTRQAGSMQTPYFKKLHGEIMRLGGLYNAHLHLCRSGTLDETEALLAAEGANQYSHLSIPKKHGLIPLIHGSPAYDRENLRQRVGMYLQLMADVGTTRADTLVDVTTDRVGLSAFEELLRFKEERRRSLDLQIGAYTPMGFMDSEPERWRLVEHAAETADFVGSLPERD